MQPHVSNSTFFVGNAKFVISELNTWGWVLIAISTVQIITALCVFGQIRGARWVGVLIAAGGAASTGRRRLSPCTPLRARRG